MNFFESLAEIVQSIGDALVNAFNTIGKIFYTPAVGDTPGAITFVGYLALATLAISLLGLGMRTIMKLVNKKA